MTLASDILQKVKIGARELQSSLVSDVGTASEFIRKSPVTSAVTVAGGVLAGVTAVQIVRKVRKKSAKTKARAKKTTAKKPKSKRKKYAGHTKRGWKLDRAKRSKEKHEVAYQRRKKSSKTTKKRVGKLYYTKKGQPYKIMASGKARFVKKSKGRKK